MAKKRTFLNSGKMEQVAASAKADFTIPSFTDVFDTSSNMVPLHSGVHAARMLLADKGIVQAISLKDRQAPLVEPADAEDGNSLVEQYGKEYLAITAPKAGEVKKIKDDEIEIQTKDGVEKIPIYNNFPMGRKSFLHNTPQVQVGDKVKENQLLATSNFTDDQGRAALGTNLITAITPARGHSFEDAYQLSEAGAKKLAAEQMMKIRVEKKFGVEIDKNKFISIFPNKFTNSQLSNINTSGVVKVGSKLQHGDPIVLARVPKTMSSADMQLGNLSKTLKQAYTNVAETWHYDTEGEVVDVSDTGSLVQVTIKTIRPMQVGDKLSSLGFKGVIGRIVPDTETPTTPDGEPVDLFLNTMSITSRVAPAVAPLLAFGKVAQKTGKRFRLPAFTDKSLVDEADKALKDNGLSDTEELYDPVTGKNFKALVGPFHVNRLVHISEDKVSSAGGSSGRSFDQQPSKNEEDSPKKVGNLGTTALLSNNAFEVLKDIGSFRSTKNDEYWRRLKLGLPLPQPETPFIFKKFMSALEGSGVHVEEKKRGQFNFLPQTNNDVTRISTGAIEQPLTFKLDNKNTLIPEKGGLFDPVTTGLKGDRYNHIDLNIKVPNPISEEPLRKVLGMTGKQYEDAIVDGSLEVRLGELDIDQEMDRLKTEIKKTKGTKRDNAVKSVSFLNNLKKNSIGLKDLLLDKIPVIPAQYRPIVAQGDLVLSSDVNNLYKDLILVNSAVDKKQKTASTDDISSQAKRDVYKSVKAIYGLGQPVNKKSQEKNLKGLLGTFLGIGSKAAKSSKFQANVVNKPVDLVGRNVLKPDPTLGLDEVSLPMDQTMKMYSPFVMRRLVQRGIPATESSKYVKNQHPLAMQALAEELKDRPVLVTRDPQWHKFNNMAFFVRPNLDPKDTTIGENPLVFKGQGADSILDYIVIRRKIN